jgi:predicted signal transduction protein with EAL and GGDEF domain
LRWRIGLLSACADVVRWPKEIAVAVSLWPIPFDAANPTQTVILALAQSELAPQRLELKITENCWPTPPRWA